METGSVTIIFTVLCIIITTTLASTSSTTYPSTTSPGLCTRFDGLSGNSITFEIYEVPGTDTISSPSVVSNSKRYRELIPLYGLLNTEINLSLAGDTLTDYFGFTVLNNGVYLQLVKTLDRDPTSTQNGIITDFDPIDTLSFLLTCTVIADSSSIIYDLSVKILDLNDHIPVFIEMDTEEEFECSGNISVTVNHYHRRHFETLPVGSIVAQVKAYDYDSPDSANSRITYHISDVNPPWAAGVFIICQDTGEIILKTPFANGTDNTTQYQIRVIAKDGGEPPKSQFVIVYVNITRNDHTPAFSQAQITSRFTELGVEGAIVARPTATDADENTEFNQVRYKIDGDAKALRYFEVEPLTGEVRLKESVARDTETKYIVKVIAYDAEESIGESGIFVSRSSTATITINAERNMNNPALQGSYSGIKIKNTDFAGASVATISAIDADGDALTYEIDENSEAFDYFYIHPRTGQMRLISGVTDKTGHTFQVPIIIRDDGMPSKNTTADIAVEVLQSDVDACGPYPWEPFFVLNDGIAMFAKEKSAHRSTPVWRRFLVQLCNRFQSLCSVFPWFALKLIF